MLIMSDTATELRERAAYHARAAQDSFDRSDTNGFLSQWASDLTAQKLRKQADILDQGGRAEFPALFDVAGNLVPAKLVHARYGPSWGLLPGDDPQAPFTGWFSPSRAKSDDRRIANDLRKGYTVGTVLAPAKAVIHTSGEGLSGAASARVIVVRADGGFSWDVIVVDPVRRYSDE
jgi:hypothetical protein